MAKKPTVTTVASGYYGRQALNDNFEALRDAFDNTLSRDGSTPNSMGADLDMNSKSILNALTVNTEVLKLSGTSVGVADLNAAGATLSSISHTGDGSTLTFSTGYEAFIKDNTQVYIDGVYQRKSTYSISGSTLTFSVAPTLNSKIEIVVARTLDFGGSDAANVGYTQGSTGSVNRTVLSKLQETVSVKDFGAVGDGVTDDTVAIQAAADYCASFASIVTKRPKLVFEAGKQYRTTDQITFTNTTHIDGCGASIRSEVNNVSKSALHLGNSTTSTYMWKVQDLTVSFSPGTSASAGITIERFLLSKLERLYVSAFTKQLVLSSAGGDPFVGWLTVDKCYFQGGQYGVYGVGTPVNDCIFNDGRYIQHSINAIRLDPATSVTIRKNDFSFCTSAIRIANGGSIRIQENYTESCGSGTENNLDYLATFTDCSGINFTNNSWNGVNGTWRDRTHVYTGIGMFGCSHARVQDNSFTYFQENAVYFDANTGPGCVEANNRFSETFADPIGVKTFDASGLADIDGKYLPPATPGRVPYVENYCPAPREIANEWTAGADVTVARNTGGSTPYFDGTGLSDRITYGSGSDKGISIATSNVVGATGQKFAVRFWANLLTVSNVAPLSGTAVLRVRILDGATILKTQYITLSKMWKFYEFELTDTNTSPHAITISIAPADLTYMEFAWALIGVQYCRAEAPYIYDRHSTLASYSREYEAAPDVFPKVVKQDQFTNVQTLGTAAPASGTWVQGDVVWNRTPSAGGNIGWVCTTGGSPGTWKTFGSIAV